MINRELAETVRKLMPDLKSNRDPDRPVSIWKEVDRIRGFPEQTTVVIFRTTGCSWYNFSSCSMCGYFNDVSKSINEENLMKQVDFLSDSLSGSKVVKVFTSGSFLDPIEIPLGVRDYFFQSIKEKVDKALIESRTEYITVKNLTDLKSTNIPVRIAVGLESANDNIIRNSVNKGSTFAKFLDAASVIRKMDLELRTYLLLKPPFISEKDAIADAIESVRKVSRISTDVSVNPMNIQKNTLVEKLWKRGLYRPPRLWSLAKVLIESSKFGTEVLSYPTGGNRDRGVHNDKLDQKLLDLIVESSLKQDFSELADYYNAADLSSYLNTLELEATNFFQPDFEKLLGRTSSASMYV
ncbi:radical SAM protein [Thermoplasmatales archaeon]|nr:radical SAM protein [Thermoplasmatales archaeon]